MNTKITLVVKEVTEKEKSKGDRLGIVKFEGKALRGTQKLAIFVEQDEAQEFQVGEFYEVVLKQVKAPEQA